MAHIRRKMSLLIVVAMALLLLLIAMGAAILIIGDGYVMHPRVVADLGKASGTLNMDYGLNEEANWMAFAEWEDVQYLHTAAGSRYIRIWLDDPPHRPGTSTIPYEDGNYDFTNLDSFVNAALESGATPYMAFAFAPDEMGSGRGLGNADVPRDSKAFAAYCREVVSHYNWMCENGHMAEECDVDGWYWEIWNEPYWDYWWEDSTYVELYNDAYREIKSVEPNTKVGGYSYRFLTADDEARVRLWLEEAIGIDFISIHAYGNYPISPANDEFCITNLDSQMIKGFYQQEMIGTSQKLFYDRMVRLQEDIDRHYKRGNPEIIMSELGPNWNWKYEPYLDEQYVAAWYASAMAWMIKSGAVDKEFYYSGTSNQLDGGFALWSINSGGGLVLFPAYSMKRDFVRYNQKGSILYSTRTSTKGLEALMVSNQNGTYLTLINRKGSEMKNVNIDIKNRNYTALIDLKSQRPIRNSRIDLEPYEVRFIQVS